MDLGKIAIIVSIIAALIGIFGGVPGIKKLFFDKPKIEIIGFMPVAVFDEASNRDTTYPKFSLKGFVKIANPNDFDVSINELKIYGRSQDSSGKYKFPGNKPIIYEMKLVGTVEEGEDIIKAHGTSFLRFHIAHFENELDPGVMHGGPFKAVPDPKLGHHIFHIYKPTFNQLFKFNDRRVPFELVEQVDKGLLHFAILFNNELIPVDTNLIYNLQQTNQEDWKNQEKMVPLFNGISNLKK
jgi:hypothetical protein